VPVHECSDDVLAAMCDTQTPQGLLAVCRVLPARLPARLDDVLAADPRLVCVLTHVRDPGNAGTVLRAADGAGVVELPEVDLRRRHAWVFGNEAWGLPASLRARCEQVVRVPIHGRAESLNLAMAATVCLYASAGALRS
jgi:tRNA G18 (ribose-2'-O)-methylase SpoU